MIPFIDLAPVVALVAPEMAQEWQQCLAQREFVGGPSVAALEQKLRDATGVAHAVGCASGSSALTIALQSHGVRKDMRVALPNLTFWASYEAIAQLSAQPVLVDIDAQDLQMDFARFVASFEQFHFTHAVLPHLYGWATAKLDAFREFCKTNSIALIEDGAQCFGALHKGQSVLAGAQTATLSFYPAKVLGGCMDGGAMLCADTQQSALMRQLANHGRVAHYQFDHVGWNSRMSGLQARYLLQVLQRQQTIVANRQRSAQLLRAQLQALGDQVHVYTPPTNITENGYLNVFTSARHSGDDLVRAFAEHGVTTGRTYPGTMAEQLPARGAYLAIDDMPSSTAFARKVVNLPLFYGMSETQLQSIARALTTVFSASA